ncbi:MAG: 4-(cytidine 5'-diphospho)-2-C-methyl-D-erythritol kinase [Desulfuromonadaceae bacterium]|nr:4-(cytidine 5'-diphospho)-2-C-methyl-D-erythritol kinase [Desulfuromonadaceae bacterium]MDD5107067.1 4-(cytidine 5'-diphospho)-2-C-methyl-D-erythritol kinase [Desulfuromonadaceae bacterium]
MNALTLYAPAKINYVLDVIRKRPDGYHDLRMIMQRINLCDEISLSVTEGENISVACSDAGVPDGPENIAWRAARMLLDHVNLQSGVNIRITKRIPVAAGLGGGSSDAASVLLGVNQLLKLNVPMQKLLEIGQKLGADVPFFVFGKNARAEGIGEMLSPLDFMPKCWILLVNPGIPVSTAWVYRSLQLTSGRTLNKLPEFNESIGQIVSILSNDLESVTIPAFPVIADIKALLLSLGAEGSMMSGSGPTVFGIFDNFAGAENARRELTKIADWFAVTVETL